MGSLIFGNKQGGQTAVCWAFSRETAGWFLVVLSHLPGYSSVFPRDVELMTGSKDFLIGWVELGSVCFLSLSIFLSLFLIVFGVSSLSPFSYYFLFSFPVSPCLSLSLPVTSSLLFLSLLSFTLSLSFLILFSRFAVSPLFSFFLILWFCLVLCLFLFLFISSLSSLSFCSDLSS